MNGPGQGFWGALRRRVTARPPAGSAKTATDLGRKLISQQGEAAGTKLAAELASLIATLDPPGLTTFFSSLVREFAPDAVALKGAAEAYLTEPSDGAAARLAARAEPPRQELLRRLNMAPGGTALLLDMRARVLEACRGDAALEPLAYDLTHLLSSWFNRGFLTIERIDWNTPAAILERLIRYEAVHAITSWDDLRNRLTGERRCFGFFHPALPGEPLIFIEVILTRAMSASMEPLLAVGGEAPAGAPNTAIFYSISSCQPGLRNISFGNLLIKQVVADLVAEIPTLKTFATLSPIPGFRAWLDRAIAAGVLVGTPLAEALAQPEWWRDAALAEQLRPRLTRLCGLYLTGADSAGVPGRAGDSVARFHLSNGARLERINWLADLSPKGLAQSWGMMVNYRYVASEMESNHTAFVTEGRVVQAREVRDMLQRGREGPARRVGGHSR